MDRRTLFVNMIVQKTRCQIAMDTITRAYLSIPVLFLRVVFIDHGAEIIDV